MYNTIVAQVVRLRFSNNRNPAPRARARPRQRPRWRARDRGRGRFFVTIGYIRPASGPSFACSEHCL